MNTEELTPIVTAHQSAIARHDLEMADIRAVLAETARRQEENRLEMADIRVVLAETARRQEENRQAIAQLTAEQQLSRQDINQLTASILELRNIVSDYIQNRSRTE